MRAMSSETWMGETSEPGPMFSDPEHDPRLSVELLTNQLVEQASVIITAQHRLRQLLKANHSIVQELSLDAVLRRLVAEAPVPEAVHGT